MLALLCAILFFATSLAATLHTVSHLRGSCAGHSTPVAMEKTASNAVIPPDVHLGDAACAFCASANCLIAQENTVVALALAILAFSIIVRGPSVVRSLVSVIPVRLLPTRAPPVLL